MFVSDLSVEHVLNLLCFLASLEFLGDLTLASSFVLLDALLDVLALLSLLKFFIFVVDHVRHFVHDGSDAFAAFFNSQFTLTLSFQLLLNHPLDVFSLAFLALFFLSQSFLLFFLVVENHLHCSLTFYLLLDLLGYLFVVDLLNELLRLFLASLHFTGHLFIVLFLSLLKHLVSH